MATIVKQGKITPSEAEICNILLEECAEVIQAVSKVFRFGWDSCHPDSPNFSNKEHLTEELGDLMAMVKILCDKEIIDKNLLFSAIEAKAIKLSKFSNIKL
jgi:NTP pyrophosphatase (non-canonical NTP hydrolase)